MATIDALVAEALIYISSGDPDVTNANLVTWWNRRQEQISAQARWWYLLANQNLNVTVATGIGPYTLTGTPMFIEEVLYSGTPLPPIPWSQGQIFYPTAGSPQAYDHVPASIGGTLPGSFYVFPVPDATYTLNLWTFNRPTELVYGSSQSNIYTDNFPRLVICGMCMDAFARIQDSRNYEYWKGEYNEVYVPMLQYQQEAMKKGLFATPRTAYAGYSPEKGH